MKSAMKSVTKSAMKWVIAGILLLHSAAAFGASEIHRAADKKLNQFIEKGVIVGGEAGRGFSLLGVRRYYSKAKKLERLVLDLGDLNGEPLFGAVSYFTVGLEKAPARIVIDLAQVQKSGVDQKQLAATLSKSPYIKRVGFIYDPEDQTSSLELKLVPGLEMEVFKMPSLEKPSRIVVDLRRAKNQRKKSVQKNQRKKIKR